jgi:hypothetical protein
MIYTLYMQKTCEIINKFKISLEWLSGSDAWKNGSVVVVLRFPLPKVAGIESRSRRFDFAAK